MKLNKYLIYNPQREKPKKFFANEASAIDICKELSEKSGEEMLLLKVMKVFKPNT